MFLRGSTNLSVPPAAISLLRKLAEAASKQRSQAGFAVPSSAYLLLGGWPHVSFMSDKLTNAVVLLDESAGANVLRGGSPPHHSAMLR